MSHNDRLDSLKTKYPSQVLFINYDDFYDNLKIKVEKLNDFGK
jgi:hypothetical protein